jgi:20S proteasome subunit beta 6
MMQQKFILTDKYNSIGNNTEYPQQKETKEQYNPYVNNNGSVIALKGKDYIMIAADSRLSVGYSILSRDAQKIFKLTDSVYLASSGMYADMTNLYKNLKIRIELYKMSNKFEPGVENIAQLLSNTLYSRRFFPYYTFNLLAGINSDGELKMYGYDAVGSHESLEYGANGSGKELIAPILDSILKDGKVRPDYETGKELTLSCMNSCANRDIYTGDSMNVITIFKDRVVEETFPLRKD